MKEFYQKYANILHMSAFIICALVVSTTLIKEIKIAYYIDPTNNVASVASTATNEPNTEEIKMGLKDFNTLIVEAVKQHSEAPELHKKAIYNSLTQLLKDRKTLILEKIKTDPQDILDNRLPTDVKGKLSAEALGILEKDVELEGKISVIHIDDFEEHKNSKFEYNLITKSGKPLHINFAGKIPDVQTGAKVHLKGVQIEEEIAVAGADGTSGLTVVAAATVATTNNTLFILANFYNKKEEKMTPAQVYYKAFTAPTSSSAFYTSNSGGIVNLTGDVVGWYTLDISSSCTDYYAISDKANAAATANGVDLSKYGRIVYVLPLNSCANALGSLGGNPSKAWVAIDHFMKDSLSTVNHELGHNMTVHHANRIDCKNLQISDYLNCTQYEYGDASDVMGNVTTLYFNAPHQIATNWINGSSMQTVTTSGKYTISPIESGSGLRVLKIAKPNTNESYYVSYRQPVGFTESPYATNQLKNYSNGANIHIWNGDPSTQTKFVTLTPGDDNINNETLLDGTSFGDPVNGIKVTQISHSPTSVEVSVEFGPYVDTSSPTVAILPPEGTNSGTTFSKVYISDLVKNNIFPIKTSDDVGVKKVEFYKNGILYNSDDTDPFSITLDIAADPDNTTHIVQAKAYDAAGNVGSSATGTVIVDNTIPTTIINSPLPDTTVSGKMSVNITSTDNIGLRYSYLLIDGILKTSMSHSLLKSTSLTFSWDTTVLADGQHTVQVLTYDLASNVTASQSIVVNTENANIDKESPVTSITSPLNNSTVVGTQIISTISTDDLGLTKIELLKDGTLFASQSYTNQTLLSNNNSFSWDTKGDKNGTHTLQTKVYDVAGKIGTSPLITVNVNNVTSDTQLPSVPINLKGVVVSDNQINLSWDASTDNVGIAGYIIYMNGIKIKDTASPSVLNYAVSGLNPATEYSFTVSAYDTSINFSPQSTPIKVTTTSATLNDFTPPVVSITSPANGTKIKGKSNVNISVLATDQNVISTINIYTDNNLVQTCSLTSNCSYSWPGKYITTGSHTITATAIDNSSNKNQGTTSITITK